MTVSFVILSRHFKHTNAIALDLMPCVQVITEYWLHEMLLRLSADLAGQVTIDATRFFLKFYFENVIGLVVLILLNC